MSDIEKMLQERDALYGNFSGNAIIAQNLKDIMHSTVRWKELRAYQKEGLDMIAHKIARILKGDPNYADNWRDIEGYAKLVADRCSE